jgi:hypothetical protein
MDGRRPGNVLVLRQAQDEDEFRGRSVEILILSLSKDEDFFPPPSGQTSSSLPNRTAVGRSVQGPARAVCFTDRHKSIASVPQTDERI